MTSFNLIDPSKQHLKYLGWSVDCRKPEPEWTEMLKHYDGCQIRELAKDDKNLNCVQCSEDISLEKSRIKGSGGNIDGHIDAESLGINAKFHVESEFKTDSSEQISKKYRPTRRVTFLADFRNDPNSITMNSNGYSIHHYSLFEQVLSNYILEFMEKKQRDPHFHCGKKVKDLQGENPITKLDDYVRSAPKQTWQQIANACTSFIEEKRCTHYVYTITLGTRAEEKIVSQDSQQKLSGKTGGETAHLNGEGKHSVQNKYELKCKKGEISNNTVTKEEVIDWKLNPISSLICRESENLKCIMEELLTRYAEIKYGEESGPYNISCQDIINHREIYWQVINGTEIQGTTVATHASEFHLKYIKEDRPELIIMHKPSADSKLYVKFTESLDGLELVPGMRTSDISEISFILQTHLPTDKPCLPATPHAMKKEGPFFIKKSEKGGLIQWILRKLGLVSAPYIGIAISEDTNTYSLVSYKQNTKEHEFLMLFTMIRTLNYDEKWQPLRAEVQYIQPLISTPSNFTPSLWQVGAVVASAVAQITLGLSTAGIAAVPTTGIVGGAIAVSSGARLRRQSQPQTRATELLGVNYDFPIPIENN